MTAAHPTHSLPKRASWLAVLLLLLPVLASADLTTGTGGKKKKKDDEREFLPEAKPINVRFIAGMTVDIELDAVTAKLGTVRFIIRDGPKHGTLSAIRPHPRELHKAIVTYTHNGDAENYLDSFTYACKLDEGSWSAPSPVSLLGRRAEPRVELTQWPSFSKVLPGFEGSSRIKLKNTGIAPFASDIAWQAPWSGPPRIELAIGEEKEFLITVKPTAPGTVIWETELQPGEEKSRVKFYVECAQPFVVAPGHVRMFHDPTTGARRGKIGVANATELPMTLVIEPPERVLAVRELVVQPKQTAELDISLAPEDVRLMRGELWVINEPYRERVLIDAAPEPAQAMLLEPQEAGIDFGTRPKGKMASAKVVLQNIGGEPAVMAAQATPPFRVAEQDSALSIAPGDKREVVVEGLAEQAGKHSSNIIFSGTGGKLSIAVRMEVTDPNTPQSILPKPVENPHGSRPPVAMPPANTPGGVTAAEQPSVRPPAAKKEPLKPAAPPVEQQKEKSATGDGFVKLSPLNAAIFSYLGVNGMPIPKEFISSSLERVEALNLVKQGRDMLEIGWKEPEGTKPKSYRLELASRMFHENAGRWIKTWREAANVEDVGGKAGLHTVRMSQLTPETRYEVRVLGVDEDGKVSQPSDIYAFATAPPWRMPPWAWQAVVGAALLLFIFVFFRIRRGKWEV